MKFVSNWSKIKQMGWSIKKETWMTYNVELYMKRLLILFFYSVLVLSSYAQDNRPMQIATSSIPNKDAKFLLFPTQNYHIFLKLNTRTGEVYMVQYSLENNKKVDMKIDSNLYPLAKGKEQMNGRFFLYPTTNIYNFMLLDQVDGRVWQVQWSFEEDKRFLTRISSDTKLWSVSDSVKIGDLEYRDYVYYKNGELFNGFVSSKDGKTVMTYGTDGRIPSFDYGVFHDNGKTAIIVGMDSKGIEDGDNQFFDENEEKISLSDFKRKYPSLLLRAKSALKEFEK